MRWSSASPALAAAALTLCLAGPSRADLSREELRDLQQEVTEAVKSEYWNRVADLFEELGAANDSKVLKWMIKVVERKVPEYTEVPRSLRFAAAGMDWDEVEREVKREATRSSSAEVRRNLLVLVANHEDWDTVIEALEDDDEEVAALAAWRLIEARVESAVEPMISEMEDLDDSRDHIWDVYRNGLGRLLGKRLNSGAEYRSYWTLLQDRGGLAAVEPSDEPEEASPGGSSVRLFGREIACTRVVFVLDVSGSMETIDPNQADPLAGSSRTRGGGDSEQPVPRGKTRLERAQIALKEVIDRLPSSYEINIVAYSSRVKIWRAGEGDAPPLLHELTDRTREDAGAFVDDFRANGVTVTDDAIRRAYDVAGARCFYLLSDGFATHDGQTPVPTSEILATIDEFGGDRHVAIHTMGFEGADRAMMRAVAEHTGGRYSDIE